MIYVAKVEKGQVTQVMVMPDAHEPGEGEVLIGPENTVGIGWAYDGAQFLPPEVEEEGELPPDTA
ncbi:hypothetical protein [Falsirhodobacter deserti]|uniref:hypothetical protein n=1 Tax=Falsirhodobacter deserti TaxID=1365611 RepID=UPI000FE42EB0|nr:hypothetical protein [Falsirhodobacter deserti]